MVKSLCKYKDIFGAPGTGFHSTRLFNIAIYDLIATLVIGIPILYYFGYSIIGSIAILMVISYVVHKLFCVDTTINKYVDRILHL